MGASGNFKNLSASEIRQKKCLQNKTKPNFLKGPNIEKENILLNGLT